MTDVPRPDDDDLWIISGRPRSSPEDLLAARERMSQFREKAAQLREAMSSRDVIRRAKGILMLRYTVSASQALELLRAESDRSQVRLHDVAIHLTRTGILRRPGN